MCVQRGKEREKKILIVKVFLQACNMIKGIIDLVLILPWGCYLFLQHENSLSVDETGHYLWKY